MTGFRKGKGTTDALQIVVQEAEAALRNDQYTVMCCLDIESAYDRVDIEVLLREMRRMDIDECLVKAVSMLFRERHVVATLDGINLFRRTTWIGLPQGSPLSPLCFNIYITGFLKSLKEIGVIVVDFADDVSLLVRSSSASTAVAKVQQGLDIAVDRVHNLGLSISATKCSAMIFCNRRPEDLEALFIGDVRIRYEDCLKLLGLHLTPRLTWGTQVRNTVRKAAPYVNFLRSIAGQKWGADPIAMLTIYKSCVRSIIEYGSIFYSNAPTTVLLPLDRLQWKCLRICLGATKTCHTGSLEVLAGVMPLKFRRSMALSKYVNKRMAVQSWYDMNVPRDVEDTETHTAIQQTVRDIEDYAPFLVQLESLPCFLFEASYRIRPITIDLAVHLKLAETPDAEVVEVVSDHIRQNYPNHYLLATDGSKSDSGTGYAVVEQSTDVSIQRKLPSICSSYVAEVMALLEAVNALEQKSPGLYVILTDSMGALQSLESVRAKANRSVTWFLIKKRILDLEAFGYSIVLLWVPSHQDIELNELADVKAKDAVLNGEDSNQPMSALDTPFPAKARSLEAWQQRWTNGTKGRYCHRLVPIVCLSPWFNNWSLNRREIVILSKLIANHSRLPAHLHRNRIIDSPACTCGAPVADPDHLIFSCPNYDVQRIPLLVSIRRYGVPPDVTNILERKEEELYKKIVNFIVECNIDM